MPDDVADAIRQVIKFNDSSGRQVRVRDMLKFLADECGWVRSSQWLDHYVRRVHGRTWTKK